METTRLVGAAVFSAFIALNVWVTLIYVRKRISLDPRSTSNHAIMERFDSPEELQRFHEEVAAEVTARANAALSRYQQAMQREFAQMDPGIAQTYPIPKARFEDLI